MAIIKKRPRKQGGREANIAINQAGISLIKIVLSVSKISEAAKKTTRCVLERYPSPTTSLSL